MSGYSLILKDGGKVLFASRESGLKPLVECVGRFAGKVRGGDLTDKVVGMGAARLIVLSEIASRVRAGLITEEALAHLTAHGVQALGRKKTIKILDRDGTRPCPMELLNEKYGDDRQYLKALFQTLKVASPATLIELLCGRINRSD